MAKGFEIRFRLPEHVTGEDTVEAFIDRYFGFADSRGLMIGGGYGPDGCSQFIARFDDSDCTQQDLYDTLNFLEAEGCRDLITMGLVDDDGPFLDS